MKGRNGYKYVGKLDGRAVFINKDIKDGFYYKEVSRDRLVEMTGEEEKRFGNQRIEFTIKG